MKRSRSPAPAWTLGLLLFLVCRCQTTDNEHTASAEDALSTFQLEEGFEIELVASEPLVGDPVDIEIDENGKFYVVEMPGYPLDITGSGQVRILSDTNADGRMDKSAIFADNLVLPTGIMRWKKGVLVTDAPNVFYLEDTNGDDIADIRDTVLTGFALSNPQHNLNNPLLGIDNWIYLAHEGTVSTQTYEKEFGDTGSDIYFPGNPNGARLGTNANSRSVRFRPDQLQVEELASHTQFGHTFDMWGRYLAVTNYNHIYQEVIAQRYLARNPNLPVSDATQSLSDHANACEVFPITTNAQHQLLTDVGVVTSACGLTVYLGGAFPPPYNHSVTFVAEPVHNLVHVDQLSADGSTFVARRLKPHREFLASTDARFRPVNLYVGPDGALYVVDYYRQIIEHPEWMDDEVVQSGELYADSDRGRIYRITATNRSREMPALPGLVEDSVLVGYLAHPNAWWRMQAQRLLIDHNNKSCVRELISMTKNPSSAGRLHALWTLDGLQALTSATIINALSDPESGIRENAIKLAETRMSNDPKLVKALIRLKNDTDARVRFQLLCTLGYLNTPEADRCRNEILFSNLEDKWKQIAALTGANPEKLLETVIRNFRNDVPDYAALVERISAMIALARPNDGGGDILQKGLSASDEKLKAALLEGLAQGIAGDNGASFSARLESQLLDLFFNTRSPALRRASLHLLQKRLPKNSSAITTSVASAQAVASDSSADDLFRADAIDLLGVLAPKQQIPAMGQLIRAQQPLPVQLAALRTLSAAKDTTLANYLVGNWRTLTPGLRDPAIKTFLTGDGQIRILLRALENGDIPAADVEWPRRVSLMGHSNHLLRDRARAIFTSNSEDDMIRQYQQTLNLQGNEQNGEEIFDVQCARCHQVRGKSGNAVGPDLGTVHNWSREAILVNTLAPNRSISSGYDLWSVTLDNGEIIQGIISSETPGAITLRNIDQPDRTINRKQILEIQAMNLSLMPDNLADEIDEQQMADLLAYLKQNK